MSEQDKKDYEKWLKTKKYNKHDFFNNHILGRNVDSYLPFYDEYSDYNTNAKSYYDYLARFNKIIAMYYDFINRLLRRNIEVEDTESIEFNKMGDWIDNGECPPENFDDIIKLLANVKISKETEERELKNLQKKKFDIINGTTIKNDGVWSPDYWEILKAIDDEIGNIQDNIQEIEDKIEIIENEINNLKGGLQKIIDNLYKSGAITNNNLNTFEFKNERDIATGNINLFGGQSDGSSFIRTTDGSEENDITAGIE